MSDSTDTDQPAHESWWRRRAPATIVGIVIIGIIVSIIYDMLVRPGLTTVGRFVLDLLTFGSDTIKDTAYSRAAINPTPTTALFIFSMILSFTMAPVFAYTGYVFAKWLRKANLVRNAIDSRNPNSTKAGSRRKFRVFLTLYLFTMIPVHTIFSIQNQSVRIWQSFHTHLATIAPYISEDERLLLSSQFATIEGRDDYTSIANDMGKIAADAGVKLREIELW